MQFEKDAEPRFHDLPAVSKTTPTANILQQSMIEEWEIGATALLPLTPKGS
jgi:hypothetical protein